LSLYRCFAPTPAFRAKLFGRSRVACDGAFFSCLPSWLSPHLALGTNDTPLAMCQTNRLLLSRLNGDWMKRTSKISKRKSARKKPIRKNASKSLPKKQRAARGIDLVDAELRRSLGLTMRQAKLIFQRGGDSAERKFMECCRRLWKVNGSELIAPFIETAFDFLPEKSRRVLFERMLTIVYVAQDTAVKGIKL
jgi:hypothetical protein